MTVGWEGAGTRLQLPLRRLFERLNRPVPPEAGIVTAYTNGEVTLRANRAKERYHEAANLDSYQGVEAGDFVVHGLDIMRGSVGVSDSQGAMSPVCTVLRPRQNADSRFMAYAMRLQAEADFPKAMARGVRDGGADFRRWETLAELPLPVPPVEEQRAIANYLDRETAQIDELIKKQTDMIARLLERRTASIRRVLTSGLGNATSMRPSDIPLIERIPSHWQTVPTRHLCRITTGSEDSGNADPDGEYPFYVRGREVLRIGSYGFDGEAVMTPGDGQGGTGKVFHYVQGKFQAHQRVYVFTDFRGVQGMYFYHWLSTFLEPIALAGSNTVTMESLRRPLLTSLRVAVPPLDEQRAIISYLGRETAKIDDLITKAGRFIELTKERRAALITAAVTGRIDVTTKGTA